MIPEKSPQLKWPELEHWSLLQLLRLRHSWQQIVPENAAQQTSLAESLQEVDAAMQAHLMPGHTPRAGEPR